MIIDKIKQIANESGYELTEYAEKIAKAKERFLARENGKDALATRTATERA